MHHSGLLFQNVDWFTLLQNHKENLRQIVERMDKNQLPNTSSNDLCEYLLSSIPSQVPEIMQDDISIEPGEADVDVSKHPEFFTHGRTGSNFVKGTKIDVNKEKCL